MSPRPDRATIAAYVGLVAIAGTNFVAVRFSNAELAPFWGATLRFAIAGSLFFLVMALRHAALPRGRALVGVIVYGALGFGASYALLYWALQTVPAGLASVIIALVPLLTSLFAAAHGLEQLRLRGLIGGLVAAAGIAIVFAEQLRGDAPPLALLACIAGAACIAESSVAAKMFPRVDPSATNAVGMLAGLAILAPLVFLARETPTLPARMETVAAVAYLVTIGSIGLFALFLYVLRQWTATATSYILVLAPLVTIVLASALAEERVTGQFVIGAAVVGLGVFIGMLAPSGAGRKAVAG